MSRARPLRRILSLYFDRSLPNTLAHSFNPSLLAPLARLRGSVRGTRKGKTSRHVVNYAYLDRYNPGFKACSGKSIWKKTACVLEPHFVATAGFDS